MKIKYTLAGICFVLISCNLFHKKHSTQIVTDYVDSMPYETTPTPWGASELWSAPGEILFTDYKGSKEKKWLLQHTELSVEFNFERRELTGTAQITLTPNAIASDTLELDAKRMQITSIFRVLNDIKSLSLLNSIYKDSAHLKIIFPDKIQPGNIITVEINYIAKPYSGSSTGNAAITDDKGLYFINHDLSDPTKPRQIWTQGETESNSHWFPTIDAMNQKMTQKIAMTVPDTMVTLSNGVLVSSQQNSNGTRTDIWEQKLPHAPYLTMMAAGNWATVKTKWRDKEVNYLVEKSFENYANLNFGNTPEMIEFFSRYTGVDFPWDKYSQVVVRDFVSGAMENTTATVHMQGLQQTPAQHKDNSMEDYVSHELFHQWFGDLVTAESWADITLNESFATYGEYLWRQHKYGQSSADHILDDFRENYNWLGADEDKTLVRHNYKSEGEVFDNVSYQKGACILHMLKYALGEDVFKHGLSFYLSQNRFKTAEADNLRMAMEEASGKDLHWFFDQWYFGKGHPKISLVIEPDSTGSNYQLHIEQTQQYRNAFVFPVKITWQDKGTIQSKKVFVTNRNEYVPLTQGSEPDWFIFDADNALLADVELVSKDVVEMEKQVAQLHAAYPHASNEGTKYHLFSLAAHLADFSQNENVRKAFGPFLRAALHSTYDFTAERALRYENVNMQSNPWSDNVTPDSILAIARNYKLASDIRVNALSTLFYMHISEDTLLRFTSDSSEAVSAGAINMMEGFGNWVVVGKEQAEKEPRKAIALAWTKKLLRSGFDDKKGILQLLLKNSNAGLTEFYAAYNTALIESQDDEDLQITRFCYDKFVQENRANYIKMMIILMKKETENMSREIERRKTDGEPIDTALADKKAYFDNVIKVTQQ